MKSPSMVVSREKYRMVRVLSSLALFLSAALSSQAQTNPATGNSATDPNAAPVNAVGPAVPGDDKIYGQIRNRKGHTIPGLRVSLILLSHSGQSIGEEIRTDKQGRFAYHDLSYGGVDIPFITSYEIKVSSVDGSYPAVVAADNIKLTRGIKTSPIAITVTPGVLIKGRVLDKRSGNPWVGVTVDSSPDSMNAIDPDYITVCKTDAAGRYHLRVLAGKIAISAEVFTEWSDILKARQHRTAREGTTITQDFQINSPPTLVFVDANRKPVANASLLFTHEVSSYNLYDHSVFKTDHSGKTKTYELQNGRLRARKGDLFASRTLRWESETGRMFITNDAGDTTVYGSDSITVLMTTTAPASIAGDIADAAGKPVPQAVIRLRCRSENYDGRDEFTILTDSKGHFHAPLTLDGGYSLFASTPGYPEQGVQDNKPFAPRLGQKIQVGTVVLRRKLD